MLRRLPGIVGCVAVVLSCFFAASSQAPPASTAKPGTRALQVYTFDARATLKGQKLEKQRQHPEPCFGKDIFGPYLAGRPYFSLVSPPSEIREIDLDGLKKLLQRDPKDPRPLLVNFWATWCDPCREEFPDLVKLDADYPAKRLNFVAVSLDDITDIKTAVPKFLKEMNATMPVVLLNVKDPEPAIHVVDEKWDGQLPATFLYDKDGKVVFRHFGKIQPAELRAAIDKLVSSK